MKRKPSNQSKKKHIGRGNGRARKTQPITPGPLLDEIRTPPHSPDSIIIPPSSPPTSCSGVDGVVLTNPSIPSPPPTSCSGVHGAAIPDPSTPSTLTNQPSANKSKPERLKRADAVNWCDRDEVRKNAKLFDAPAERLLRLAEKKRTDYPNGFDKGNYFENLTPIIASGYDRAEKIVCCGREILGKPVPCDQWSLCSKCAYMRGMFASGMYKGLFNSKTFFHITLGFDEDIPLDVTNSVEARVYWKMNQAAIRKCHEMGLIDGAYLVHELSIRSLHPLRINPHTHVIVCADKFPDKNIEVLKEMIGKGKGINLKPSIVVKQIDSQKYYDNSLRYLTKAIDLQAPYKTAWNNHCSTDRKMGPEINRQMRIFLDGQAAASGGMYRVVRLGNLMPQSRDFIGVKKGARPKRKKKKS